MRSAVGGHTLVIVRLIGSLYYLPKGVGEGLISGFAPIPHTLISN